MPNPLLLGFLTVFKKVATKVIEQAKKDHKKTCDCNNEENREETSDPKPSLTIEERILRRMEADAKNERPAKKKKTKKSKFRKR